MHQMRGVIPFLTTKTARIKERIIKENNKSNKERRERTRTVREQGDVGVETSLHQALGSLSHTPRSTAYTKRCLTCEPVSLSVHQLFKIIQHPLTGGRRIGDVDLGPGLE